MQADRVVVREDGARPWPTTAWGATSTPAQRAAAEAALADILTSSDSKARPLGGGPLELSYVPFTDFGREEGEDLTWYAQIDWGTWRWRPDHVEIGAGDTAAEALRDILLGRQAPPLLGNDAGPRLAAAVALEQQWAGWSELLARAADVAALGPASADEPSDTSVSIKVRWNDEGSPPGWAWEVTVPWIDSDGREVGVHLWQGANPAEALRAALAEAHTWWQRTPPQHGQG